MSDGFRAHPDRLGEAAKKAHEHADKVEAHSRNLGARTRGRSLGKGRFGQIVEKAVRPVVDSMVDDMGKAMAKGHRSIGHGLDITKKNIDDAEEAVRRGMRRDHKAREAGVEVKVGEQVLGEDGLRDQYRKRVSTRINGLRKQGHAPQRHLDPTDDMLKARLGQPVPPFTRDGDLHYHLDEGGYIQTSKKIDPAHGPNPQKRLHGDRLYSDADHPDRNHKCGSFSTAFQPGEDEAFLYAEQHARRHIDLSPNAPDPQPVIIRPEDAWGPGDHSGRFRGFYVDPANPMTKDVVNYKPVDFKGAHILAVFAKDGNGGHRLVTMYPEPDKSRNR